VLKSSASRSEDPSHVVTFYGKSLEVHEYYARKFCDNEVLQFVRKEHFSVFMRLALTTRSTEALKAAQNLMQGQGIQCQHLKDYFNVWVAKSDARVPLGRKIYPLVHKIHSISNRFRTLYHRLT